MRRSAAATVLTLAALVLRWVVIEIAFALHGFPGVPRYLFEPAGVTAVLGGVAVGWLLLDASRIHRSLPSWVGIPLAAILVAAMVPGAVSQIRTEHKDVFHERMRTTRSTSSRRRSTRSAATRQVLGCGRAVVNVEYASIMAWYVHLNTGLIGYRPDSS